MRCLRCGKTLKENFSSDQLPLCVKCIVKESSAKKLKENDNYLELEYETTPEGRETLKTILENFIAIKGSTANIVLNPNQDLIKVNFNETTNINNERFNIFEALLNCPAYINEADVVFDIMVDANKLEYEKEDLNEFKTALEQGDEVTDKVTESLDRDTLNSKLNDILREFVHQINAISSTGREITRQDLVSLADDAKDSISGLMFSEAAGDISLDEMEELYNEVFAKIEDIILSYPEVVEYKDVNFFGTVTEAMLEDTQEDMDREDANERLNSIRKELLKSIDNEKEAGTPDEYIKSTLTNAKSPINRKIQMVLGKCHLSANDVESAKAVFKSIADNLDLAKEEIDFFKDSKLKESLLREGITLDDYAHECDYSNVEELDSSSTVDGEDVARLLKVTDLEGKTFYQVVTGYYFDVVLETDNEEDAMDEFNGLTIEDDARDLSTAKDLGTFTKKDDLMDEGTNANSETKYEVVVKPYDRVEKTGYKKVIIGADSDILALVKIMDKFGYGYTDANNNELGDKDFIMPTFEEAMKEFSSSNADGCDYVLSVKNLSTGKNLVDETDSNGSIDESIMQDFEAAKRDMGEEKYNKLLDYCTKYDKDLGSVIYSKEEFDKFEATLNDNEYIQKRINDLKEARKAIEDQAPFIGRGGNYDTRAELDADLKDIDEQLAELEAGKKSIDERFLTKDEIDAFDDEIEEYKGYTIGKMKLDLTIGDEYKGPIYLFSIRKGNKILPKEYLTQKGIQLNSFEDAKRVIDDLDNSVEESVMVTKLEEKLPKDLATAYNNSEYATIRSSNRRDLNTIDYENANYTEVTPEEAIQLKREGKAHSLRIIINKHLVTVYNDGQIELNYGSQYPIYKTKTGRNVYTAKEVPFAALVKLADKIYVTDEYSVKIPADKIARRTADNVNAYMRDSGTHNTDKNDWEKVYRERANNMKNSIKELQASYDAGDISRKEFEQRLNGLKADLTYYQEKGAEYLNRRKNVQAINRYGAARDAIRTNINRYKELKDTIASSERHINHYTNKLNDLKTNGANSSEYKWYRDKLSQLKYQLKSIQQDINDYEQKISAGANAKDIADTENMIAQDAETVRVSQAELNKLLRKESFNHSKGKKLDEAHSSDYLSKSGLEREVDKLEQNLVARGFNVISTNSINGSYVIKAKALDDTDVATELEEIIDSVDDRFIIDYSSDSNRHRFTLRAKMEEAVKPKGIAIPAPFNKYYTIDNDINPEDEYSASNVEGYDLEHVAYLVAKDRYADALDDCNLGYAEIVKDGDKEMLVYVIQDKVYPLDINEIKDCLEMTESKVVKESVDSDMDKKVAFLNSYDTYTVDNRDDCYTRSCRFNDIGLSQSQVGMFLELSETGEINKFWDDNEALAKDIYQEGRMGAHLVLDSKVLDPADFSSLHTFEDVKEKIKSDNGYEDDASEEEAKYIEEDAQAFVNNSYNTLLDFDKRVDKLIDNLKAFLDAVEFPE